MQHTHKDIINVLIFNPKGKPEACMHLNSEVKV